MLENLEDVIHLTSYLGPVVFILKRPPIFRLTRSGNLCYFVFVSTDFRLPILLTSDPELYTTSILGTVPTGLKN